MSLKLIKFGPRTGKPLLIIAALACVVIAWFFVKWQFASARAPQTELDRPESKLIAGWLARLAPDDPLPHLTYARVLEKTFDAGDLSLSLAEYERSVALSPNNYLLWQSLGRARERVGDRVGAENALERAATLAPSYASVKWMLGNVRLREGNAADGLGLMVQAAEADPQYSAPVAQTAWVLFDGDVDRTQQALGDRPEMTVALVIILAGQKRFTEAVAKWTSLAPELKRFQFRETGGTLLTMLTVAKQFALATRVAGDMLPEGSEVPHVGQISNGGFEAGVKIKDAGLFEWQIAAGSEPQIVLSEAQKRSGAYALMFIFHSMETASYRSVSQTVAVEPGAVYDFEAYYQADLKTAVTPKWEIADGMTGLSLAKTEAVKNGGGWSSVGARFTVPSDSDAVIIRLIREGCGSAICPIEGRLTFDDLALKRP